MLTHTHIYIQAQPWTHTHTLYTHTHTHTHTTLKRGQQREDWPGKASRLMSPGRPAQVSSLMGVMVQVCVHWPLHSPALLRIRVSMMHFSSPFSCTTWVHTSCYHWHLVWSKRKCEAGCVVLLLLLLLLLLYLPDFCITRRNNTISLLHTLTLSHYKSMFLSPDQSRPLPLQQLCPL